MDDVYQILDELKITYQKYAHPAVFTVGEAEKYDRGIDAGHTKNLFLRNKKGDKHYLVVLKSTKQVDLKKLGAMIKDNKLSFASPERLLKHLGLTPGSVSPFGLINNIDKKVTMIIDNELMQYEKVAFHPNINTATVVIKADDFKKFINWTGNKCYFFDLP